jgi:hypothetical protein
MKVGSHLVWAREQLKRLSAKARQLEPVGEPVPIQPLRPEVKLEEVFGYKGE